MGGHEVFSTIVLDSGLPSGAEWEKEGESRSEERE
jgi:hypothetical protein